MADERQFDSPKILRFGDKTAGDQAGDAVQCAQCEAMLADALDGTLAADQQERFDAHVAECGLCSQMLADARRGVAWLEMLRTPGAIADELLPGLIELFLDGPSIKSTPTDACSVTPLPPARLRVSDLILAQTRGALGEGGGGDCGDRGG